MAAKNIFQYDFLYTYALISFNLFLGVELLAMHIFSNIRSCHIILVFQSGCSNLLLAVCKKSSQKKTSWHFDKSHLQEHWYILVNFNIYLHNKVPCWKRTHLSHHVFFCTWLGLTIFYMGILGFWMLRRELSYTILFHVVIIYFWHKVYICSVKPIRVSFC